LSGCRGLAINWLIVGIVGLRYLRSRDTRENGIVRAGPSLISLCGHHIRPHRFGLVAPAFSARLCSTRKTKSRHPPNCGRALFRSDDHAAVRHRGRSLLESHNGCQRQRLSFIRRGDCANQASRKTQRSQRISWAAVPSKRSSPPAEKSGVCIGETPLSQAKMPETSRIQACRDLLPNRQPIGT